MITLFLLKVCKLHQATVLSLCLLEDMNSNLSCVSVKLFPYPQTSKSHYRAGEDGRSRCECSLQWQRPALPFRQGSVNILSPRVTEIGWIQRQSGTCNQEETLHHSFKAGRKELSYSLFYFIFLLL